MQLMKMQKMHQLLLPMYLHEVRAGPGATSGFQAPSIVLATLSFTHDVSM